MTKSIQLDLLWAAITLAKELDYGRAARRCGISVAEVRRLIYELEEQLCFRLFHQNPSGIEVTRDGEVFVRACTIFLNEQDCPSKLNLLTKVKEQSDSRP